MSVSGRKGRTFRKLEVKESIKGAKGFTKIIFAHKAAAGETFIDVNFLNTPTTEMPSFTNPTASRIIESRMYQFQNNVTVLSSLNNKTLIKDLNYEINSNTTINFINGYTSSLDEIFTVTIDADPISGLQVVDARTPSAEGDLAVGETDFAIGFATQTNVNNIMVYRNGIEQKRNTGNSDVTLDGNYYLLAGTDPNYGNVIVFNDAVVVSDDYIRAVGIGNTVESPTNSTWDELEKQQGQLDKLIDTTAALAGVPTTDFQATPNNVDLKQFGDRVLAIETARANPFDNIFIFDSGFTAFITDNTYTQMGGGLLLQPGFYEIDGMAIWSRNSGTAASTDFRATYTAEDGDNTATVPATIFTNTDLIVLGEQDATSALGFRRFEGSFDGSQLGSTTKKLFVEVLNTTTIYLVLLGNIDPTADWTARCVINAKRLYG